MRPPVDVTCAEDYSEVNGCSASRFEILFGISQQFDYGKNAISRIHYPAPPDTRSSEELDVLLNKIQKVLSPEQFEMFQFRVLKTYHQSGCTRKLRYGEGSKMKKSYQEFLSIILKLRKCLNDTRLTEMTKFGTNPEEERRQELQSEFHRFDDIAHKRFSRNIDHD